jgi:hypothetical protein
VEVVAETQHWCIGWLIGNMSAHIFVSFGVKIVRICVMKMGFLARSSPVLYNVTEETVVRRNALNNSLSEFANFHNLGEEALETDTSCQLMSPD